MRRKLMLALMILLVTVLLGGCMDYSGVVQQLMEESEADANATPAPTMGPLTAVVFTDRNAVYEWYNEVSIGDMLTDLTEKYGEPEVEESENGQTYLWKNEEGYGFAAVFYENGRLRAKIVAYDDIRQLKDLSAATHLSNVSSLTKDHNFSTVCAALGGKPVELAAIAQDSSVNPEVNRLFAWLDTNGNCAQILFDAKEGLQSINYNTVD